MPSQTNNYVPLKPKHKRWVVWPYVVLLLIIGALLLVLANKQNIYDWWRLRGYTAPASVMTLAKDDTMTPYAIKLLKINHPEVLGGNGFNDYCPNDGGEKTIVLGCYHSLEAGIYLLDVSDPRLDGVEQVTAAHETLHAAYGRLSSSEKKKIDGWLLNYYNHDLHDQRIISVLAEYRKTEPGQVVNEMHSIFGTEVMNLPPNLENYYKQYFSNRQKVVSYADQYQSEFTTRQNEVTNDDNELTNMKSQIDSLESSVTSTYTQIQSEQKQLASLASSGNTSEYNSLVGQYNQLVNSYNSNVEQLKSLISSYNNIVATRNSVALTENQLYSELSGSQASAVTAK